MLLTDLVIDTEFCDYRQIGYYRETRIPTLCQQFYSYSAHDRGAKCCDDLFCLSLCMFVCPRAYLRN